MPILDLILGRPLATSEEVGEQIGAAEGIPIFGLDALGSAAYGPEAAMTLLIPLGLAGLHYVMPMTAAIIILLIIVYFSYRQTIAAYPRGGGSYTVAHQNLGTFPGVLAGAALLIDYALDAAVGISAGIGALTSAVPSLHPHTLMMCLGALALMIFVNLRGNRESGLAFMVPTYLFIACMLAQIAFGIVQVLRSGGHPTAIVKPPEVHGALVAVSAWLLIKAFASGCAALTGVEAVSNGVRAFREPTVKYARRTLTVIILALAVMLAGIAYLSKAYGIMATDPNSNSYQSVLSMLFAAIAGRGIFYYVSIGSVLAVLILSANTAFAGFPRVCRVLAEDAFLPLSFANRGRRLVYSEGIIVLAIITAALLIAFGGITDKLIPLFAVGAFLAFTMSQAGMVEHWRKQNGAGVRRNMLINGVGALATGLTTCVIIVAKFTEGAWITVIAIPSLVALMLAVRRHYSTLRREIASHSPLAATNLLQPVLVVMIQNWNRVSQEALHFAMTLSKDIKVIHASEDKEESDGGTEQDDPDTDFLRHWTDYVEGPAQAANLPVPELVPVKSPYRYIINPIIEEISKIAAQNPNRRVIAVIPELVERRWYYYFLHSQRATLLKARLLTCGNDRISVLNIPWNLKSA